MDKKRLFNLKQFVRTMRWPLVSYRIILVIFSIAIMIISVLCIYPVAAQDITVEPQQESFNWDVDEDEIKASGIVWVNNSGYFDLEDISIDMQLSTLNELYINSTKNIDEIAVGEDRRVKLNLSKDTDEIPDKIKRHLINNQTEVNFIVDVKGRYSYSLVKFDIEFNDILNWEGLINDIQFRYQDGTVEQKDDGLIVEFPVDVNTKDMLDGKINVNVSMYNEEETKLYDSAQAEFDLGKKETIFFKFYLKRVDANDFINKTQHIKFRSEIDLIGTGLSYTMTEEYTWKRILEDYTLKYHEAGITTDNSAQYLTLPLHVSTNENDFISGDVLIDVGLYHEDKRYSGDNFTITLGQNQTIDLKFKLAHDDAMEIATNSMTLTYRSSITLKRYGYTFDYDGEQYYWGAPLDGLIIDNLIYSGNEAAADISFENDSPTALDLTFEIDVFNSMGDLIGETQESYFIPSGGSIDETLTVSLTGIPDYAVITFREDISGFEYQKEVDVYEGL